MEFIFVIIKDISSLNGVSESQIPRKNSGSLKFNYAFKLEILFTAIIF